MDDKAKKILLTAYWDSKGWKRGDVSKEDHAYAIMQGAMFRPATFTHTETLLSLRQLCKEIDLQQVVAAFLYSLSTRKLEYRSALGTYVYGKSIPDHDCTNQTYCNICGYGQLEYHEYHRTWDVFNFERVKWGGVRHGHSSYAMFDLLEFKKLPRVAPTKEDVLLFKRILQSVQEIESGGPRDLEKAIASFIPSNKAEREILLGILGICSVLETEEHKGFLHDFCPLYHRDPPPVGRSNDWHYPVSWWKTNNRINSRALKEIFGDYLDN